MCTLKECSVLPLPLLENPTNLLPLLLALRLNHPLKVVDHTTRSTTLGTLRLTLRLEPSGEDAAITYLARLRAGDIGGLAAPAWVEALSTSSPTAEVDPNKTLNLTKFVGDLAQASASARPAVVAQFVVDVTRR